MEQKPKIYLFCLPAQGWGSTDVMGYAFTADGEHLASHLSSNDSFSRHDMGLTSNWKHEGYKARYPDGYTLEWVDNPQTHPALKMLFEEKQPTDGAAHFT